MSSPKNKCIWEAKVDGSITRDAYKWGSLLAAVYGNYIA